MPARGPAAGWPGGPQGPGQPGEHHRDRSARARGLQRVSAVLSQSTPLSRGRAEGRSAVPGEGGRDGLTQPSA